MLIDPIKVDESLYVIIQTLERGTNTYPIDVQNQKDSYIKILSKNKSLQVSKDESSNNKAQETKMPYRHPNHKSHCD